MIPNEGGSAPFYIGETVVAVDAIRGSLIKNGQVYKVNSCDYAENKDRWFWYVGVVGHHNRLRPGIFASLDRCVNMKFEEMVEHSPVVSN